MAYKVTAPLVLAHDASGNVRYHYSKPLQDTVIPWLRDDEAEKLLRLGMVEEVGDKASVESEAAFGVKPKKTGTKEVWVDYAVSQGADRAEAEASTREELVELYGDK